MDKLRQAAVMALEALESCTPEDTTTSYYVGKDYDESAVYEAITALREALEQPDWEAIGKEQLRRYEEKFGALPQPVSQDFETWWEREGQEFLYALNTTTDDDIKLVAEFAWKNGAYKAEQPVSQEPVAEILVDDKDVIVLWHKTARQLGHQAKLYTAPQPVSQEPVALAWEEGYRQGIEDERTSEANIGICGFNAKVEPNRQNPYSTAPQPVSQEPVCCDKCGSKLGTTVVPCDCAAPQPVKEVELTDDEIKKASLQAGMQEHYMGFHSGFLRFARAVIAAYREKNK